MFVTGWWRLGCFVCSVWSTWSGYLPENSWSGNLYENHDFHDFHDFPHLLREGGGLCSARSRQGSVEGAALKEAAGRGKKVFIKHCHLHRPWKCLSRIDWQRPQKSKCSLCHWCSLSLAWHLLFANYSGSDNLTRNWWFNFFQKRSLWFFSSLDEEVFKVRPTPQQIWKGSSGWAEDGVTPGIIIDMIIIIRIIRVKINKKYQMKI